MLTLFNSLTQKAQIFKPIHKDKVLMYVCGITPYDTTHLGHAFLYVQFDALRRFLIHKGYVVNYTQNITDVDDSILEKAKESGKNWKELGDYWSDQFASDMKKLNVIPPTNYIKASDSISKIIEMVSKLIRDGFAYKKKGNVYFEIKTFPNYGELSKLNRDQMIILSRKRGADPDDPLKKDPLDFILWQESKDDEPGWDSPWGMGRPGWHIECSAMIYQYLGEQIDIHGGGRDLIYPHHESEIAQSESFTNKHPFVKFWVHAGMVGYKDEKMSKSKGNLIMVADLLTKYSPNAIRYLLLSHHYPIPWEYFDLKVKEAQKKVDSIEKLIKVVNQSKSNLKQNPTYLRFIHYLEHDFNTPEALLVLEELASQIQKNPMGQFDRLDLLRRLYQILGFKIN